MFAIRRFCIGAALGLSLLAAHPAHAQTLLPVVNPSFEQHTGTKFPGWNHGNHVHLNYTTTATPPLAMTGHGYAQFSPVTGTAGIGLYQYGFTHVSTARYAISGYYLFSGSSGQSLRFHLAEYHNGNPVSGGPNVVVGKQTAGNVGHYVKFSESLGTLKSLGASYQRAIGFSAHGPGGQIRLDNLNASLRAAPAPEVDPRAGAPALALALGGLALMGERRRRRQAAEQAQVEA